MERDDFNRFTRRGLKIVLSNRDVEQEGRWRLDRVGELASDQDLIHTKFALAVDDDAD